MHIQRKTKNREENGRNRYQVRIRPKHGHLSVFAKPFFSDKKGHHSYRLRAFEATILILLRGPKGWQSDFAKALFNKVRQAFLQQLGHFRWFIPIRTLACALNIPRRRAWRSQRESAAHRLAAAYYV